MLAAYGAAYGLKYAALRYFNAAGADPGGTLAERHVPESHLIPIVLEAAAGKRGAVTVYGTDYDTPDGTCIRDYIHVNDLCEAHLATLEYLARGGASGAFNLGTGVGHSVKEVITTAERVSGRTVPVVYGPRRPGDPARLVRGGRPRREAPRMAREAALPRRHHRRRLARALGPHGPEPTMVNLSPSFAVESLFGRSTRRRTRPSCTC